MNFKLWIENEEVSKWWLKNMPQDYPFIEAEVEKFAETISNPVYNAILLFNIISGKKFTLKTVYGPKEICGNLLNIKSTHIEDAGGMITDEDHLQKMMVSIDENDKANLIISIKPMSYTDTDETLLKGIIIHELRHAADYHSYMEKGGDPNRFGSAIFSEIDLVLYAKHIFEARAYAEQLRWLMKKLNNNVDLILKMLKRGLGLPDPLYQFAETFLKELIKQNKNESFQHNIEPPAVVDSDAEDQAVIAMNKIIEIMRFSKNTRKL
jgi:hypothetical protein